jgi:hypothetical protein
MSFLQAHPRQAARVFLALLTIPAVAAGQVPDSAATLERVRVTVSRDAARPVLELPFAVSRLELD